MSSGTSVIHDALKKIGAYSVVQKPQPDSISIAKDTLNSMLLEWLNKGIDLGVTPLDLPGDELGEPEGARNGIVFSLAILLAPDFNVQVTPSLARNASVSYRNIVKKYQPVTIPKKVVSSTLPRGAGNTARAYSSIFHGKNKTVGN